MFGATSVARIAITTITTRISISVNPARSVDRRAGSARSAWRREAVIGRGSADSVSFVPPLSRARAGRGGQLDTEPGETVFIARLSTTARTDDDGAEPVVKRAQIPVL